MLLAQPVLIAVSMVVVTLAKASALNFQPLVLSPDLINVGTASLHADREQFILTGTAKDGGCVVGLLTKNLVLLALRFFPGVSTDYCGFASVDSAGDILVQGISRSPDFRFTSELEPGVASIQFVMKL